MRKIFYSVLFFSLVSLFSCTSNKKTEVNETAAKAEITRVKHTEWSRNAVIYEVNIRQYTPEGTFKAFGKYLPQLKELGVDILWLMPVHPISELNKKGSLGSYYAVQNYHEINPEFGTKEDFKLLVDEAHRLGFKVILDWVANHTGCDNVWTKDHPERYVRDSVGGFVSPYDWTDTYKLDYENKETREAMTEALKYWVKEFDIDGYRCDVAYEVPVDFWNNARKELDAIKPVFMLAEAEHPDLSLDAFDMVYNWPLKDLMAMIAKGEESEEEFTHQGGITFVKGPKTALNIDTLLMQQDTIFPQDVYQMNHITNHDLNSWDGTEFDRLGDGTGAFAVLTYTLNGMPLIYTGQETGYNHVMEFFEKDAIPASALVPDATFEFYKKMNALKHSQAALAAGSEGGKIIRYKTVSPHTYVFERVKDDSRVVVFLNLSKNDVKLNYENGKPEGELTDYLAGSKAGFPTELKAWEYKIFVR